MSVKNKFSRKVKVIVFTILVLLALVFIERQTAWIDKEFITVPVKTNARVQAAQNKALPLGASFELYEPLITENNYKHHTQNYSRKIFYLHLIWPDRSIENKLLNDYNRCVFRVVYYYYREGYRKEGVPLKDIENACVGEEANFYAYMYERDNWADLLLKFALNNTDKNMSLKKQRVHKKIVDMKNLIFDRNIVYFYVDKKADEVIYK